MAESQEEDESRDEEEVDQECQVITEVAVQQAMNKCGSDEAVYNQLKRMVGLGMADEYQEPECGMVLEKGLTLDVLTNSRRVREWVVCEAWRLVKDEDLSITEATEKAWAEARAEGEKNGIEV